VLAQPVALDDQARQAAAAAAGVVGHLHAMAAHVRAPRDAAGAAYQQVHSVRVEDGDAAKMRRRRCARRLTIDLIREVGAREREVGVSALDRLRVRRRALRAVGSVRRHVQGRDPAL
jgi:hypothetical protein